jgi:hypothetical protein
LGVLNSVWILFSPAEDKGTALLQRVCRERYNKGVGGVLFYYVVGLVLSHFTSMCLNLVFACHRPSQIVAKFCFDPSLRPLRQRNCLIATVCKLFSFGDVVTRSLFGVILHLGLAAAHLVLL